MKRRFLIAPLSVAIILAVGLLSGSCDGDPFGSNVEDLDIVVMLESSASMAPHWLGVVAAMEVFFNDPGAQRVSAGMNFFPPEGVADVCAVANYVPLQVALVPIPANAAALASAMAAQEATGATPTYAALMGSLSYATTQKSGNPTHEVIAIVLTDGTATECETNWSLIIALALDAYNSSGVRTYVVGLGNGAPLGELNALADAGGTTAAYHVTGDMSDLTQVLQSIVTASWEGS